MNKPGALLDELRAQYEAARESADMHADVESFQAIDARLRKAFRWLEKAVTYLSGLKPPIDHRFEARLSRTARAPHRRFPGAR